MFDGGAVKAGDKGFTGILRWIFGGWEVLRSAAKRAPSLSTRGAWQTASSLIASKLRSYIEQERAVPCSCILSD